MQGERLICVFFFFFCSIRVKHLNSSTNIERLAREIIAKCDLIHEGKQREVEQLLYYLQTRQESDQHKAPRKINNGVKCVL